MRPILRSIGSGRISTWCCVVSHRLQRADSGHSLASRPRSAKHGTGEQPASSGVIVKSQIIKANGEPIKVDYMMRLSGDNWLISDIYLDGAISEVATRRSEFAGILKTDGIDGLISALNRKAEVLAMSAARTF
jgi:hypothetical protein